MVRLYPPVLCDATQSASRFSVLHNSEKSSKRATKANIKQKVQKKKITKEGTTASYLDK